LPTPLPKSAEHYRREAKRLRRKAATMQSDSLRGEFLAMAIDYEGLAESVEVIARVANPGRPLQSN
jgi:hypothetical protein